jgi:membrane protein required for colicin V production
MNVLDWVFIIIIAVSSIYGIFKGLIKEASSILAIIIGWIAASKFYMKLSPVFNVFGLNDQISNVFSFIIIFLAIFIALILIGKLIHRLVHSISLGWLNRLGGMGFGFIKGVILSSIIIIVLTITLPEKTQILSHSKLSPHIMGISKVLVSFVPKDLKNRFMEKEKRMRKFFEKKIQPNQVET